MHIGLLHRNADAGVCLLATKRDDGGNGAEEMRMRGADAMHGQRVFRGRGVKLDAIAKTETVVNLRKGGVVRLAPSTRAFVKEDKCDAFGTRVAKPAVVCKGAGGQFHGSYV